MSRFLSKKLKYDSEDAAKAWKNDALMDALLPLIEKMMTPHFTVAEGKEAAVRECFATTVPKFFEILNPVLKDTGFLIYDEKMQLVDFWVGNAYCSLFTNP